MATEQAAKRDAEYYRAHAECKKAYAKEYRQKNKQRKRLLMEKLNVYKIYSGVAPGAHDSKYTRNVEIYLAESMEQALLYVAKSSEYMGSVTVDEIGSFTPNIVPCKRIPTK